MNPPVKDGTGLLAHIAMKIMPSSLRRSMPLLMYRPPVETKGESSKEER
jgi:hypothetical protein